MQQVLKRRRIWLGRAWKQRQLLLFVLPAVVLTLIFNYRPIYGILMAFQDFDIMKGIGGSAFVGLDNFREVLRSPDFYNVLRNTVVINLLVLFIAFPLPIVFAIVLNELASDKFKRTVQSIVYLPHFISWIIIAGLFYKMLEQDAGVVNLLLDKLGVEKIGFFREAQYFKPIYMVSTIWKDLGWNSIIYFAAITSIDPQQYEAAEVDGASRLQKIWNITIPSIFPTIAVLLVLTIGNIVSSSGMTEPILAMRNPMVAESSDVIDVYVIFTGIQQGYYSVATAIGLMQAVVSFLLLYGANKLVKKMTGHGFF